MCTLFVSAPLADAAKGGPTGLSESMPTGLSESTMPTGLSESMPSWLLP